MDIKLVTELWSDVKKYLNLQIDYVKLTAIEKLTIILSTMTFVGVVMVLGACILFYLSSALVSLIDSWIECTWGANLIVGCIIFCGLLIVVSMKKKLIFDPVAKFVTKLFLNPTSKK